MRSKEIFDYLYSNKEWIFSGIGIIVVSLIFRIISRLFLGTESKSIIKQTDKGSNNTQIGIQNNYYKDKDNE